MKHKILIAVALLFFSSCMKVKKKEDDAPPVAAQVQQLMAPEDKSIINSRTELDYNYEVSETTDFHKVHFFAPSSWDSDVIVKKIKGTEQSENAVSFNDQGEWIDILIPGDRVTYQFYSKVETEMILLGEAEVLPVLDLKVEDQDVNLAQLYNLTPKTKVIHLRNLEIHSQKHLFIEHFSGTIVVDHLKTDNGFIQTFPIGNRAADDQDGKSGGQVNLVIKNGDGQLAVLMKGQNGGNGSPAKEPDASLSGAVVGRTPGADFVEIFTQPPISFGGFSGFATTTYECKNPPGSASNGLPGLPGFTGHFGRNGGDSGSIRISNLSQLISIDLHSLPGSGGKFSRGGMGGSGSDPGEIADGSVGDLYFWFIKMNKPEVKNYTLDNFKLSYAALLTKSCAASVLGSRGGKGGMGPDGGSDGEGGMKQPSYINSIKQP